MKLRVFHHNGQLAEFPLEFVHSIEVHGHDAAKKVNAELAKLLKATPTQVSREPADTSNPTTPGSGATASPEPALKDLATPTDGSPPSPPSDASSDA